MIIEIATFSILPDKGAEFEQAFAAARGVITQAEGCGAVAMHRSIETPGRFVLTVEWPTVAHHMEKFRTSLLFQEWRRILGPFFAATPAVEHFTVVG
jgi:quinol monooxygenase YgiN